MSRLGSIEKGGYYPIPPQVTKLIKCHLKAPNSGRILDPCAGKGVALHTLASELFLQPYGAELQTHRAEEARSLIEKLLNDSFWEKRTLLKDQGLTRVIPEDMINIKTRGASMQLLYLNPPYDNVGDKDADTGKTNRLEYRFLQKMTHFLQAKGILVYVVPQSILSNKTIAEYLTAHYKNINVYRFPGQEYDRFKQIVLFAEKRPKIITSYAKDRQFLIDAAHSLDALRQIDAYPEVIYEIPKPKIGKIVYQGIFIDRRSIAKEHYKYGNASYQEHTDLFGSKALIKKQPLMAFKVGHLGGLGAAGLFDDIVLEKDGNTILIKGRIKKELVNTNEHSVDEEKGTERTIDISTEVPVTQVAVLNQDGDITRITPEDLPSFFTEWLPELTKAIDKDYKPLYTFPEFKNNKFAKLIGHRGRLYPAQKHVVCAMAQRLKDHDNGIIVGEMGVGKTRMGAALMVAIKARRSIVLSPPHLTHKWKREIEEVIPEANVIFIDRVGDVQQWMKLDSSKQIQIGIVKFTSAGAASGWVPSFYEWQLFTKKEQRIIDTYNSDIVKRKKDPEHPVKPLPEVLAERLYQYTMWKNYNASRGVIDSDTGKQLKNNKGFLIPASEVNKGNKQYHIKRIGRNFTDADKNIVLSKERTRHAPLYQYKRFKESPLRFIDFSKLATEFQNHNGNGSKNRALNVWEHDHSAKVSKARWRIADYVMKYYKNKIDMLLVDEAHMAKADDTDRGYAMHRLACASKKTVLMTGTIYGGKASTLFHLLYRTNPDIREAYTNKLQTGRKRINLNKWIQDYGMIEYRQVTTVATSGAQSGNKRVSQTSKEAPGSSPAMLPWLLNSTAFLSLNDLGLALPNYTEIPVPVTPTAEQKKQLKHLENKLGSIMRERIARGDKSLLAIYLMANLMMPDAPWRNEVIVDPKTKGTPKPSIICTIPALPELQPDGRRYPKEEAIIDRIKQSVFEEDRKVLLLCQQTRTRNITDRWSSWLKEEGLTPAILNVPPNRREKWIEKKSKEGVNVLITHPRSVEVGLDLYDFPDIIWMGTEYSVYTNMQASRRSYRINQTKDVRVYFFYYEQTMQATALSLIIKKIAASKRVNGDVITSDTIANAISGSIEDQLGRMIMNNEKISHDVLVHDLFIDAKSTEEEVSSFIGDYEIKENQALIRPAAPVALPEPQIESKPEPKPEPIPITKSSTPFAGAGPAWTLDEEEEQDKQRLEFGRDKAKRKTHVKRNKTARNPGQLNLFGE
jgi:SNF2 family DNA or RNA helicase